MNQAQFRKFADHNSAVFDFVVDTDGTSGEQAGVRWYELRQTADGEPWTIYQEGTYISSNNKRLICFPTLRLRIGRRKGIFMNLTPVPKIGNITNGFIATELGYKF